MFLNTKYIHQTSDGDSCMPLFFSLQSKYDVQMTLLPTTMIVAERLNECLFSPLIHYRSRHLNSMRVGAIACCVSSGTEGITS